MKPTAVDKALEILDTLILHPEGLRSTDLGAKTGYSPGTLHRLLESLKRRGFVQQDGARGKYLLGYKFLHGFSAMVRGSGLQERTLPYLKKLAEATGQAANLGVLRGDQIVFLESIVASGVGPVMYSPPGTLAPPHCTAMGKVLMAHLLPSERERYVRAAPSVCRTPRSIASPEELRGQLAQVRRNGYAMDDEEYALGIRCLAAPVYDHTGKVIAALSVSFPVLHLPDEQIPELAALVMCSAGSVSTALGYEQVDSAPAAGRGAPAATNRCPSIRKEYFNDTR